MNHKLLSATRITRDKVVNDAGEHLGNIHDLMVDLNSGRITYAAVSFGGFLGASEKLFAVPWEAFLVSSDDKTFILNVPKQKLKEAPGFDKNHWPAAGDTKWLEEVYRYYGCAPFWTCA